MSETFRRVGPVCTPFPAPTGLTSAEVEQRRREGLVNTLPPASGRTIGQIIRANVCTRINALLGFFLAVIIFTGSWVNGMFGLLIVFNSAVGIIQEIRAKRTLDRLTIIGEAKPTVVRDGREQEIAQHEIVRDDLILMTSGTQIIVDGTVEEAHAVDIDESLLTGESDVIHKKLGDDVFSGSFVVSGRGYYRATKVGAESFAARLTAESNKFELTDSQLMAGINRILKVITWLLIPTGALTIYTQLFRAGDSLRDALIAMVGALVPMIPEGLVLMTSIAFAVGVVRLGQRGALINELPAIEGLARVDVVCTDKTGTLTENRMILRALLPPSPEGGQTAASAPGGPSSHGSSDGVVTAASAPGGPSSHGSSDGASAPASVSTTAPIVAPAGLFVSPDVAAALAHTLGEDEDPNDTAQAITRQLGEWNCTSTPAIRADDAVPFASARKWSGVHFPSSAGLLAGTWVMGAPDVLAAPGSPTAVYAERIAAAGQRVLLFAHAEKALSEVTATPEKPGDAALVPQALIVLDQKVRDEAPATVAYFEREKMHVKVISGDNATSVAAVAREVGIRTDIVVDARNLPPIPGAGDDTGSIPQPDESTTSTHHTAPSASSQSMSEETLLDTTANFDQQIEEADVFGRVTPDQKRAMVAALQRRGHTVAMTGDGVNDVLALKDANIGVAMGSGSPAARSVAQLVLLNNDFATLPHVVAEGRRVIGNIERVANLFLTKTVYSIALGLIISLAGVAFPFQPIHVTVTGWFTIGIPAFLLALPPNHDRAQPGFASRVLQLALPSGLAIGVVVAVFWLIIHPEMGAPEQVHLQASTAALAVLIIMAEWVLAVIARPYKPWKVAMLLATITAYAAIFLIPPLSHIVMLDASNTHLMLIATATGVCGCVIIEALWHLAGPKSALGRRMAAKHQHD